MKKKYYMAKAWYKQPKIFAIIDRLAKLYEATTERKKAKIIILL